MKRIHFALSVAILFLSFCSGCQSRTETTVAQKKAQNEPQKKVQKETLLEARRDFKTSLIRRESMNIPVAEPPKNIFRIVKYDSSVGKLSAYLSPAPRDGKKHPAIIWIVGGFSNSISNSWYDSPPVENDQTARAFRKAGIPMMFPSLRGGNENPGVKEGFFGEVNDVLAAADFLAKQDFVDPNRIYLGGHSTGGTLVLLTAEISSRFRAVFSFGPVSDVRGYSAKKVPFDFSIRREWELRAPALWLHCIESPAFVFEGITGRNNSTDVRSMAQMSTNSKVHFLLVPGGDHFSILAPTTRFLAKIILEDTGSTCNIAIKKDEVDRLMGK